MVSLAVLVGVLDVQFEGVRWPILERLGVHSTVFHWRLAKKATARGQGQAQGLLQKPPLRACATVGA